MNNLPRQALREIVAKHGTGVCSDAKRCAGLLGDWCGSYRREINILVNALEERVPLDLLAAGNSMPRELLLTRLAVRLEEQLGMTETAAYWAVETWGLALNILSEAEIAERERKRANIDSQVAKSANSDFDFKAETKTKEAQPLNHSPQTPFDNNEPLAQRQPTPPDKPNVAPLPTRPPRTSSSTSNQTSQTRTLPVPAAKTKPQSKQTQSFDPARGARPKKRSWTFRGCFIGCFLLVVLLSVLILGVPYALRVMRETQQQSEPQFPPAR
ncbi:MAG: hypothetical protein ABI954_04210 [Pyrinomonadaceae bacterium]